MITYDLARGKNGARPTSLSFVIICSLNSYLMKHGRIYKVNIKVRLSFRRVLSCVFNFTMSKDLFFFTEKHIYYYNFLYIFIYLPVCMCVCTSLYLRPLLQHSLKKWGWHRQICILCVSNIYCK